MVGQAQQEIPTVTTCLRHQPINHEAGPRDLRVEQDQRGLRTAYVIAYCVVLLYAEIPWAGLVIDGLMP